MRVAIDQLERSGRTVIGGHLREFIAAISDACADRLLNAPGPTHDRLE
jgi:hypothetical protein